MTVRLSPVDLSESGHFVAELAGKHNPGFASYLVLKGELGAWKQANSYLRFVQRGKPARDGVGKPCRDQLIADLCGAGGDQF
jgi:hypothetical protein